MSINDQPVRSLRDGRAKTRNIINCPGASSKRGSMTQPQSNERKSSYCQEMTTANLYDKKGQEGAPGDSIVALALQRNLQDSNVYRRTCHPEVSKLHPANDGTSHEETQQTMVVKDACPQSLTTTLVQNEQGKCIVAENPRRPKRIKALVNVEDYNNLKKGLDDQKKLKNVLYSYEKIWKAEF